MTKISHLSVAYFWIILVLALIGSSQAFSQPPSAGNHHRWIGAHVHQKLGKRWKSAARKTSSALIRESARFNFDPIFLLAVIHTESRFRPHARGRYGELGLMQLKPSTARWVARRYKLDWDGAKTLLDPAMNIRIGVAYLAYLKEKYSSKRLYLSAYNMGPGLVNRALKGRTKLNSYAHKVMRQYRMLEDAKDRAVL